MIKNGKSLVFRYENKKMINALLLKDITKYTELLQKVLLNPMSYYDNAKEEKFYHTLILGMLLRI